MTDPKDRKWWDEEGRAVDWPEELKDQLHQEFATGYTAGLNPPPAPEEQ